MSMLSKKLERKTKKKKRSLTSQKDVFVKLNFQQIMKYSQMWKKRNIFCWYFQSNSQPNGANTKNERREFHSLFCERSFRFGPSRFWSLSVKINWISVQSIWSVSIGIDWIRTQSNAKKMCKERERETVSGIERKQEKKPM